MDIYRTSLKGILIFASCLLVFSCKEKQNKQDAAHKFTNALVNETSPYLLQHAHNPVNWRPWSQEALDEAQKENKLVLVSIGYSSCHWCHVMEVETFEDESVAKIMNDNFISIKVDREERPDVDQVYMTALQLISGNGGWPLNVITLPNGKPLYGGTYHTNAQWKEVLTSVSNLYKDDPKKAAEYSDMVAEGIAEANRIQPTSDFLNLSLENLVSSIETWKPYWDMEQGGDQGAQKFMIPVNLDFLLDYSVLSGDQTAKAHLENTLNKMAQGGVYDHIGGGFFRYSTDPYWKVPHFEKMLYDNAQAISLYSNAYKAYKAPRYRALVMETIDFLKREMRNPQGGFLAAIDADSEGVEGKFYVWMEEELKAVLGDGFNRFSAYYNIAPNTVWEEGKYILYTSGDEEKFVRQQGMSVADLNTDKAEWKLKLLAARAERVRPRNDDKIITSWNALLIAGLVDAYNAFGQQEHLDEAEAIFQFLIETCYQEGALQHSYKPGSRVKEGFLEDYAYLTDAALKLYQSTLNEKYLEWAQKLTGDAQDMFSDEMSGMYKYTYGEGLIAKIIKTDDGTLPSPNAVMAHNLLRLGHLVYDVEFMDRSKRMLSSMVTSIVESAPSYAHWNKLLLHNVYPYYEVAVVGKNAGPLVRKLNAKLLPNTLIVGSEGESTLPLFEERYFEDGTFIYVCRNGSCKLPVDTVEKALGQLANF